MDFIGCIFGEADSTELSRARWIEFIPTHPGLALAQPREAINPFTKEPMMIRPRPDQPIVLVEGREVGKMIWGKTGANSVHVFGDPQVVGPIAREVAEALGCRFDPDAPMSKRSRHRAPEISEINEYRVHLERVPEGEKAIPQDYPQNLGLRTKLGGKPDWIQGDRTPACSKCQKLMNFVAQIDSIEHRSKHNPLMNDPPKRIDFMFGDVGMIYVFYCYDCLQVESLLQFY